MHPNIEKEIAETGANSKEFTRDEKLNLIAEGLMAPEDAGLSSVEQAKLEIMPDAQPIPQFGDSLRFECGIVPIELRARWAREESTIIPTDISGWEEEWREANKNTFLVQGHMQCGTVGAQFERTYSDPILGLVLTMRRCADMIEARYSEGKALSETIDVVAEVTPEAH